MAEEEVIVTSKFQLKRGLAENWTDQNPILLEGEPGAELDTGKLKIGDGTTHWNDLPYTSNLPDVNVMHFKGLIDTDPTLITTGYNPGDVVLYSTREYIWATSENEPTTYKFRELGNEEDVIESPDSSYNLWELPQGFHRFTNKGEISFFYGTESTNCFKITGPTTGSIYIRNSMVSTYYTYSIIGESYTYQGWLELQVLDGQVYIKRFIDLSQVPKSAIVTAITDDNKQSVDLIPSLKALTDYITTTNLPTISLSSSQNLETINNGIARIISNNNETSGINVKGTTGENDSVLLKDGIVYKAGYFYIFFGQFQQYKSVSQFWQKYYSVIRGYCRHDQENFAFQILNDLENTINKSTTIDSSSTDATYPSSKAVYDAIQAALLVDEDAEVN